jgi:hypothetical protein
MEFIQLDLESLKNEYNNGSSLRTLASKYGTSKITIKRKLLKLGVKIISSTEFIADKERHKLASTPIKKYQKSFDAFSDKNTKINAFNDFLKKAKLLHGDKFDYSKFNYQGYNIKGIIICPIHGDFEQTPEMHIEGEFGCNKCYREATRIGFAEFIKKANEVHHDKYTYTEQLCRFKDVIKIICPIHGEFEQKVSNHLSGNGCPQCINDSKKLGLDEFINKAQHIHGDKYGYNNVEYINSKTKINITCKKHGEFSIKPCRHIYNNSGCPECAKEITISSTHQQVIDYIKSFDIDFKINDRHEINPYELDIFIPSKMLAFEINGIYWHSYNKVESIYEKNRHLIKHDMCVNKNIRLIQIFESEIIEKFEIVKSLIRSKLGVNDRYYARKCQIVELNSKRFNEFVDMTHLQGKVNTLLKYGLMMNDELVCAMGFNRHKEYEWEISRFCSKLNFNTVGGASRLFNKFISDCNPGKVMTYADKRYSDGRLYKILGFKLLKSTKPGYFYVKNYEVFDRRKFQKHKLSSILENFDPMLSETNNMFNNGYRRLWDAGHWKFIWEK